MCEYVLLCAAICDPVLLQLCATMCGHVLSFTGPSDKMSGDVKFGSDICPMTFSSVLTRK
jgi:hypothetical protein